jgi:hypothetical protein
MFIWISGPAGWNLCLNHLAYVSVFSLSFWSPRASSLCFQLEIAVPGMLGIFHSRLPTSFLSLFSFVSSLQWPELPFLLYVEILLLAFLDLELQELLLVQPEWSNLFWTISLLCQCSFSISIVLEDPYLRIGDSEVSRLGRKLEKNSF